MALQKPFIEEILPLLYVFGNLPSRKISSQDFFCAMGNLYVKGFSRNFWELPKEAKRAALVLSYHIPDRVPVKEHGTSGYGARQLELERGPPRTAPAKADPDLNRLELHTMYRPACLRLLQTPRRSIAGLAVLAAWVQLT